MRVTSKYGFGQILLSKKKIIIIVDIIIVVTIVVYHLSFYYVCCFRIICELTKSCSGKESRVFFTSFKNPDPRQYEYIDTVKYFFMMMDHLLITSGSFDGLILTMNAANMSWRHIARTPMNVMKKILGFVQVCIHIIVKIISDEL